MSNKRMSLRGSDWCIVVLHKVYRTFAATRTEILTVFFDLPLVTLHWSLHMVKFIDNQRIIWYVWFIDVMTCAGSEVPLRLLVACLHAQNVRDHWHSVHKLCVGRCFPDIHAPREEPAFLNCMFCMQTPAYICVAYKVDCIMHRSDLQICFMTQACQRCQTSHYHLWSLNCLSQQQWQRERLCLHCIQLLYIWCLQHGETTIHTWQSHWANWLKEHQCVHVLL